MLARFIIKNVTSGQLKEIAENCGKATLIVSPHINNTWTVSVCLKDSEKDKLRNLGYTLERVPG